MSTKHYEFYDYRLKMNEKEARKWFFLNNHDFYEIYLLLEGDANYIVEDKSYPLEPMDLCIARKNEFHVVSHNSYGMYHHIFLNIEPTFFQENHCSEYEKIFLPSTGNVGNKISANIVRSSGIYDAMMRYKKYSDNYRNQDIPVLNAMIVEILHLINQTVTHTTTNYTHPALHPVMKYLNLNFTEDISLDMLEEMFFISKYHLCRIFRESTGLSVHEYVTKKRLARARELRDEGLTLNDAAMKSGFHNYTSFYRAYQKEYGMSPKER